MNSSPATILMIDDSEENLTLFEEYLRQENFEVWTAKTGQAGLGLAKLNPHLIMLDVQLPDISVNEVCKILKNDPSTASIPLLYVSSSPTEPYGKTLGLQSGADGYLTQPIDAAELIATVRSLLRVRSAAMEAKALASQLEQRVAERTASLQEAIHQLEQFSYTVSHDLRAPLRAMQGYCNILIEDFAKDLPLEALDYLRKISSNSSRLDKMIVDVLTFSRASKEIPVLSKVSLHLLTLNIIEHYPKLAPPHACIEIDLPHTVLANDSGLTQVLSNLLGNAVKFVAPGVTPQIRVWSEEKDQAVRIWVEDNGIGISPEFHERIFAMFERVLPNSPYEGSGVGLAIARKVVERMGGKIGVESDGSTGSRFWIQFQRG